MELLNKFINWFKPKPKVTVTINWRKMPNKYVINKRGTYLSLSDSDIQELKLIIEDIESDKKSYYKEDARST